MAIDITRDIDSLTDFKRHTSAHIKRIKETGHALVLTVNGKPEVVVQEAQSYQRLLEAAEQLETIRAVQAGLDSMKAGRTRSIDEALADIRRTHGIQG